MISNIDFNPENKVLSCPFSHTCNLPKAQNLCNFPDYKVCPDYHTKLQKLKSSVKILH